MSVQSVQGTQSQQGLTSGRVYEATDPIKQDDAAWGGMSMAESTTVKPSANGEGVTVYQQG